MLLLQDRYLKPADPVFQPDDPMASGLVQALPFSERDGGTVRDLSGCNTDGTFTNGKEWAVGPLGPTARTDGTSWYVDFGKVAKLDVSGNLNLSVWVRPMTNGGSGGYLWADFDAAGNNSQGSLYILAGKVGWFQSGGAANFQSTLTFTAGDLLHIAVVRDHTAKTITIYVNGVVWATSSYSGSLTAQSSCGNRVLGRAGSFNGNYAHAWYFDLRVAKDAAPWTAGQVQDLYTASRWRLYTEPFWYASPPPPALLLSGTAAGVGNASATLQVSRRLAGSAAGLAVVSAVPLLARRLVVTAAGVGLNTGALTLSRRLAGTAAGVAATAGTCRLSRLCSGTSAGSGATTAAPGVSRRLSGTGAGLGATTAASTLSRRLTGAASGAASTSAAAEIRRLLTGLSAGVGSTTGAFYVPPILLRAVAAGVGTAAATLTVARPLQGSSSGTGLVTGTMLLRRLLQGYAAGVGSTTGRLASIELTGPICYGGSVTVRTAYGGTATVHLRYGGTATIRTRYGGSARICGDE